MKVDSDSGERDALLLSSSGEKEVPGVTHGRRTKGWTDVGSIHVVLGSGHGGRHSAVSTRFASKAENRRASSRVMRRSCRLRNLETGSHNYLTKQDGNFNCETDLTAKEFKV